jgi:uncharacterized membrane protein YphA (DoxX/SURF4 family)
MTNDPQSADKITSARPKKSLSRIITAVVRILLGLPLFVGGLNGFLKFFPEPKPQLPEGATAFVTALTNTGYMLPLIMGTQLIVGALLLTNRFVPLALALLAPFVVNSVAFHLFLEPSGRIVADIFLAMELYLAWSYRSAFRPMLAAKNTPCSVAAN